jgi:hypothetical protein
MRFHSRLAPLACAALLAAAATGCTTVETGSGTFDRTLTVSGPVVLDVANGSGRVQINSGATGEVRIHAVFRVRTWPWEKPQERVADVSQHPPIEQQGNLIRIRHDERSKRNVTIDYTIVVPAETELRGAVGSGELDVRGIRGPARLIAGSGNITAQQIGNDTHATAGSGDIKLSDIGGDVEALAGSGDLEMRNINGEVRAHTGSGDITIEHPTGPVVVGAGSGDISLRDLAGDVRVRTGSGDIAVDGNPAGTSYWELHTGSGAVTLRVPAVSSFRFYAHSNSGSIMTNLSMIVEEHAKHDLRAHVGDGKARIEVDTGSGDIRID